jgi:hypothetical protein
LEEFGRVRVYAIALFSTWFLFAYAFLGLRSNVKTMRQLIDPSLWTLRQWGIYALIAVAMFVAWGALGGVLGKVLPARPGAFKNIVVLLPRTLAEKVLWTTLSLSARFCEEFVYRGYLFQRFSDWDAIDPHGDHTSGGRLRRRTRGVTVAGNSFPFFSGPAIRLCCRWEADTDSRHAHAWSPRRARGPCAAMILLAGLTSRRQRMLEKPHAPEMNPGKLAGCGR